jgi:glycyl-tRNA synthetase alpha subunit
MSDRNIPTDERVWIWADLQNVRHVETLRPRDHENAVEYVRVLSPKEWDKRAHSMEGVDTTQYLTRLHDKVEAQKREINRLQAKLSALENVDGR